MTCLEAYYAPRHVRMAAAFPFFVMQPSPGLSVASSKTPNLLQARLKSLATHTVSGLGLYACGMSVSAVVAAYSR